MFNRRKKHTIPLYDKTGKIPVIRSSICTGEQVAGFKDLCIFCDVAANNYNTPSKPGISVSVYSDGLKTPDSGTVWVFSPADGFWCIRRSLFVQTTAG